MEASQTFKTIILIIDGFGHGGIQQAYKVLIQEFSKSFESVHLVILDSNSNEIEIDKTINLRISRLESKKLMDIVNYIRFKKIIDLEGPCLIISSIYRSQIWSAIAKNKNSRLIWVEHNTYLSRTKMQWQLMKFMARKVDKLVGVSNEVRDITERKLKKTVHTVPNPISLNLINRKLHKQTNDFVFISRLVTQKNPELMLKSFSQFIESYGGNSKLHLVGGGPLLVSLIELSKKLLIINDCIFHDFISNDEVYEILLRSKTLVSTSDIEGFPLARLEALATGCCVVTTNTGGTGLFGQLEANGFFKVEASAGKIAQKMHESLQPKYWTSAQIDIRRSAVKIFDPKIVSKTLIDL
jgi:glycosyltransferase involved in cell wall biosynthesis